MSTSAKKSSRSRARSTTRPAALFSERRSSSFFGSVARSAMSGPPVQAKAKVSRPSDPLEIEADRVAERVVRSPEPVVRPVSGASPTGGGSIQRSGDGVPIMNEATQAELRRATAGGRALGSDIRSYMEPRLGADLSGVRVHDDPTAHRLSNQLSARAFTHRNHVFFGRGQYQPGTDDGRRLVAHELTHTIQQGGVVQNVPTVQRSASAPIVQRLGVRDALDYFAEKAHHVTGYRMLTLVLGFNPINMASVDRSAANLIRALLEVVPGGALMTKALDAHGVIGRAAEWLEQKVGALGDIGGGIVDALRAFVDSLSWKDIFDLGSIWNRAKRIFLDPIGRLISFGIGVGAELLGLVKQAILRPLAALAKGTAGYDLLRAVLGQDPITGDPVARTPEVLIGGFMKMIGQEEVWQNIKRSGAIGRAFAWFQGALSGLIAFARSIPPWILGTLRSLTFADVLSVGGALKKIGGAFLGLVGRFTSWALGQVVSLLEIVFAVVAPGVLPYVAKAKATFRTIVTNPVRFVGNLVRAGKLGFQHFAGNILSHLKTSLIKWVTGPLGEAGVYIPTSFALPEIVRLITSVLGLTWQNIRTKLLKVIPDPVLTGLEKTAAIVTTLVKEGPAAAWEQIKGELTELKDQLVGQITSMVETEAVKAAVTKLVSMLNPAGAVIQAILAIYNTVTFFIDKARQIGSVVASFIDSISAIAAGQVESAAKRVEQTMASTLTLVISFLAKFAGLGGIPARLVGIVNKLRQPVDRALDKIVAWLGRMLEKFVTTAKAGARSLLEWWRKKRPITGSDEPHTLTFDGDQRSARLVVRSTPEKPSEFLKREHSRSKEPEKALTKPLNDTLEHEVSIEASQDKLCKIDNNLDAAASGDRRKRAESLSKKLDGDLSGLAKVISKALTKWGRDGTMPGEADIAIERAGGFTFKQKRAIAAEYREMRKRLAGTKWSKTNMLASTGKDEVNVREQGDIDRRHVVSSHDMAEHYTKVIATKPWSHAKLLLEQHSSIPDARTPVAEKLSSKAIIAAAKRRYRRFFGYAKNIFLGDSSENRSIQEHLDRGHPEMAGKKLQEHVDRIKRAWAIDSSFKPTK